MKFNESWLREWVDPGVDTAVLVEQLTQAGLEVDAVEPAAAPGGFSGVVAARVLESRPHPNADRLKLCLVDSGSGDPVEVVCGAPNARAGMGAALAPPGARIAGGVKVRRAKIRGTPSEGMLVSRAELGIGDEHDGIIELEPDTPPGTDVFGLLGLDDSVFEVSVTPDRGDCLCVAGIAREIGANQRAGRPRSHVGPGGPRDRRPPLRLPRSPGGLRPLCRAGGAGNRSHRSDPPVAERTPAEDAGSAPSPRSST